MNEQLRVNDRIGGGEGESPEDAVPQRQRILLLIEGNGNRLQIVRHLSAEYDVLDIGQGDFDNAEFDLVLVDAPSLKRWHTALHEAKQRLEPVFLPLMLILQRHAVRRQAGDLRDIVDDFLVAPIEPVEFQERIENLLRIRRCAVEQQQRLAFFVNHDNLTGLPTRELLLAHLQTSIQHLRKADEQIYLLAVHMPLERFINSLGHQAADEIALAVSALLQELLGNDYFLARIATEQDAIVVPPGTSLEDLSHFCRELAATLHHPLVIQDQQIRLSAFIGISRYPEDAEDAPELLKAALGALGAATVSGEPQFYSSDAQKQTLEFLRIEAGLHRALDEDELELWFQPKFRLQGLALTGAEALLRWRLPSGEVIPPDIFIPIAENSALIQKIDSWVIWKACETLGRWRREGLCWCDHVAVNITPADLAAPEFVVRIKSLLETNGLPPSALQIELTETMFLDAGTDIWQKLIDLRSYGVRVAIDDFGTGYSSLSYLQRLPADILKIDKSFVDLVPGDPGGEAIVRTIVALAGQFRLELVAEGIETQAQLDYLDSLGIHSGQGYLVGRALPEIDFVELAGRGLGLQ